MNKSGFRILIVLLIFVFVLTGITSGDDAKTKLLSDIEEYIKEGGYELYGPVELRKSIIEQIEMAPVGIADELIGKMHVAGVSDEALSVYIWAIGFTKDSNAVDELIKVSSASRSQLVKDNAFVSLSRIGGDKVGDFLLSQAKAAHDNEDSKEEWKRVEKFNILHCLAEMQYVPALPEMESILKKDYGKYYWQLIFCFGKMGDKAIPYLLGKINDNDRNIRFNSIVVLGQTLLASEAAKPLAEQYWQEKDPIIRNVILSMMERIVSDLGEVERFFKEVAAKEEDKDVKKFAEETLSNLNILRERIAELKKEKKDDRDLFEEVYESLYKSYGHEGNIKTLRICSRLDDEERLKKLRERILFRNSDECFYEYQKVNEIIMFNRLISESG